VGRLWARRGAGMLAKISDVFACTHCTAAPEPLPDGNLVVVRHDAGCEALIAQTRARWPLTTAALPQTPPAMPFERWADFGPRR
jgi:hypothetical protein